MPPKARRRKSSSGTAANKIALTEYHHSQTVALICTSGQCTAAAGHHSPNNVTQILKRMFLPEGWPESCSEGYDARSDITTGHLHLAFTGVCPCMMHGEHGPWMHPCPRAPYHSRQLPSKQSNPMCLPHHPTDYLSFQAWDTFQALTSYIRGLLTSQAVLRGVGVGQQVRAAACASCACSSRGLPPAQIGNMPGCTIRYVARRGC